MNNKIDQGVVTEQMLPRRVPLLCLARSDELHDFGIWQLANNEMGYGRASGFTILGTEIS